MSRRTLGILLIVAGLVPGPIVTVYTMVRAFQKMIARTIEVLPPTSTLSNHVEIGIRLSLWTLPLAVIGLVLYLSASRYPSPKQ